MTLYQLSFKYKLNTLQYKSICLHHTYIYCTVCSEYSKPALVHTTLQDLSILRTLLGRVIENSLIHNYHKYLMSLEQSLV